MALVEFQGKDLEEAIARAAEALSLPPEKIKFSVITMGGKGFLGFGKRLARISIDPDIPYLSAENNEKYSHIKDGATNLRQKNAPAGREQKDGSRSHRPQPDKHKIKREIQPDAKENQAAREEKNKRPGNTEQRAKPNEENGAHHKPPEYKPEGDAKALTWDHVPPPLTRTAPGENENTNDQLAKEAAEVIENIISRMGFIAKINAKRIGARILLSLESEDNAILIGGRGATLEALQLITGKIMSKKFKQAGIDGARIVVDVADYRFRRQESLLENLKNLAQQARKSKKPQTLNGLNSAERRLVQMALRPYKDLAVSHSSSARDALLIASIKAAPTATRHRPPRKHGNR